MSYPITLFTGKRSRGVLPRGLVEAYNLSGLVEIVESPDLVTYKHLFPQAKYPSLIGPDDYKLHEVIAILLYLVSLNKEKMGSLLGASELDSFQVMKWLSWGTTEFVSAYRPSSLMASKTIAYDEKTFKKSLSDLDFQVGYLEENLKGKEYLVGDFVTLADLFIVSLFNRPFQYLKGRVWREEHPELMKWFNKISNHPALSWYEFPMTEETWSPTLVQNK